MNNKFVFYNIGITFIRIRNTPQPQRPTRVGLH